ncbi:hypothetical protein [Streptomyces tirandamycinicus]|uniref:DNA-3-methyladenine glycosylase 2 family protein n=1 Tax=Streptomyces tirandamycinicus TaxID=2174846 RepID=A0A2S1SRK1_9ACTN|nr:hypothetical protein [Streptomyces tirandamycinicus]AWI29029.1 hypothetical protein DDW44_09715 [Streptomyces tirandamycinicus]
MNGVLTIDHPAWIETETGDRARAVRTASGIWVVHWDREGLHMSCVSGTEDVKPTVVTTDPACLPGTVPATLKAGLDDLGPTQRLANPWLWDAISTAILRQVVRAGQARKLYRAWCKAYGTTIDTPHGELAVAPTAEEVLTLGDAQFASVGAKFHRSVLQAAATHHRLHVADWQQMDAGDLAAALTGVPRIGPWTASAAAADYTGDFSIYPHDDLAVRTWAAQIAPQHDWPDKKDKSFRPMWTGMAGPDRTALHTLTLSTLTWGSHAR